MKIFILFVILIFPLPVIAGTWVDDFEDGDLNGWHKWEWLGQNTGTLEEKNGMLIMTDIDSNFDTATTFNNGQYVGNFILSVDAKMEKAFEGDKSYIQILFRGEEQNGDFRLAFNSYYANGEAFLGMFTLIKNNAKEIDKQKLPFDFELDKWYNIELDVKGSQVALWIDNQMIHQVDWGQHGILPDMGEIQLSVGGGESHWDNFIITGDGISDRGIISVDYTNSLASIWGWIKQ